MNKASDKTNLSDDFGIDLTEEIHLNEVKIVFVGEETGGVKQILVNYFAMTPNIKLNDENEYVIKYLNTPIQLSFEICDGKDSLISFTTSFFKMSHVIFLTYNVDDKDTALHLNNWLKEVNRYADSFIKKKVIGLGVNASAEAKIIADEFVKTNNLPHLTIDYNDLAITNELINKEIEDCLSENSNFEPILKNPQQKKKKNGCCVVV